MAKSLNGLNVQITLVDGYGNVLATGMGGSTNVDASIKDFVATYTGTYYVEVTGDPGVQYSLNVIRGATFSIQSHNTYGTAQIAHRRQRGAGLSRQAHASALRAR